MCVWTHTFSLLTCWAVTVSCELDKDTETLPLQHRRREGKGPAPPSPPRHLGAVYLGSPHTYPGGEVHGGAAVEEQGGHVDVPVVGGNVQGGEATLREAKRHVGKVSLPRA